MQRLLGCICHVEGERAQQELKTHRERERRKHYLNMR